MNARTLAVVALGCVLGVLSQTSHAQPIEDIRVDMQKADFRGALAKISRKLPEAKSNPEARFELLTLRGECMVQLRQRSSALEAFKSASKAMPQSQELKAVLGARAMVELLTASTGWNYKSAAGELIDIVNPESRKSAMAACFVDSLEAMKPKIDAAAAAPTLGPIIDLLPSLGGLMALEHCGAGDTPVMTPILESLGDRGRELIGKELDRMTDRISELEDRANDLVFVDSGLIPGRRGLQSSEQKELREMLPYLDQIQGAIDEGRRINRRLGGDGTKWDEVQLKAGEIASRVRGLFASLDVRMPDSK